MSREGRDDHDRSRGVPPGLDRRSVLQAVGATGVAAATMGTASADAGDHAEREPDYEAGVGWAVPTSVQFFSFNSLLQPGPSHTNGRRIAEDPTYGPDRYANDTTGYSNADLIYRCADAGLDAYEPFMLDDEAEMVAAQEETGVYMSSAHVSIDDVEANSGGMAETYEQFAVEGRKPVLLEHGSSQWWDSEESAKEFAHRVNEAADLMADYGFDFGYSNSIPEVEYIDEEEGTRAYDVFLSHVDDHVHIQLDVAWVYAADGRPDPVDYLVEYGDKINSLHVQNWTEDDERPDGQLGNLRDSEGDAGGMDVGRNDPADTLGYHQDLPRGTDAHWVVDLVRKTRQATEVHKGELDVHRIAAAAREHSAVDLLVYEYNLSPHPDHSFEYASLVLDNIRRSV